MTDPARNLTADPTLTPDRTAEHERALLAAVLLDSDAQRCRATLAATDPAWFAAPDRAATWAQTRRVMATDPPPPAGPERVKAVHAEAAGDPHGLSFEALANVTGAAPGSQTADYYAARVLDAHLRRQATHGFDEAELERTADWSTADVIAERLAHFRGLGEQAGGPAPVLPEPLTGAGWERDPADREWLVDGWLPAGELSLLAGPGSVGKSLLALQLGAALACDRGPLLAGGDWLPTGASIEATAPTLAPAPCPIVLAGWEDSQDEALRRRGRLALRGGCTWARDGSIDARLHVLPMRGFGPLWAPADSGSRHIATVGALTPSGKALLAYAEQHKARLLVLDPAGLAIATNENDRALVSLALDKLAGWALDTGCAVLVTGHPAKATEGESADYSGSTAWRGSVRALWTLRAPDKQHADRDSAEWARLVGRDPARAERVALLTRNKNNYGWDGDALTLATVGERAGWYLTGPVPPKPRTGKSGKANGAGMVPAPGPGLIL